MNSRHSNPFLGFQSQKQEITVQDLKVEGKIPKWLSGSFISNGPAQFEVGSKAFNHWFDGFAMLKKFNFHEGRVDFQNRFLASQQYLQSNARQKLYTNEFATYAEDNKLRRFISAITNLIHPKPYDNCNINTMLHAQHLLAMTEASNLLEVNLEDLGTVGDFHYDDELKSQLSTAHPHWDSARQEMINVDIEIGKENSYQVYRIASNSTKRELIARYVSDRLFYMHSFGLSENYIILFKTPMVVNKFKLIFNFPFNETLYWEEKAQSAFVLINRRNGKIQEIETEPFLVFHSANTFEQGNEMVLDLICHTPSLNYSNEYLLNLRSEYPKLNSGTLTRYRLDLKNKRSRAEVLSDEFQEFPRINYRAKNGKTYQYIYSNALKGQARFLNSVQKTALPSTKTLYWQEENSYCGEPVFVEEPGAVDEDQGLLLSMIYNDARKVSGLIVLDAKTLESRAEIHLPIYLPFGLHGNFYRHA